MSEKTINSCCAENNEKFITDISSLCKKCPLETKIRRAIELVYFEINEQKEILSKERFIKYLNDERDRALKVKTDMFESEKKVWALRKADSRFGRMQAYLFSKEKIKVFESSLKKPTSNQKTFSEYLNHEKNKLFAQKIKEEFQGDKGKNIALMISDLLNREPLLLKLKPRENASLYRAMRRYGMNVGTDFGINKYLDSTQRIYANSEHTSEIDYTKKRINSILESINKP